MYSWYGTISITIIIITFYRHIMQASDLRSIEKEIETLFSSLFFEQQKQAKDNIFFFVLYCVIMLMLMLRSHRLLIRYI